MGYPLFKKIFRKETQEVIPLDNFEKWLILIKDNPEVYLNVEELSVEKV